MTDEQLNRKKELAKEKAPSMKRRSESHDYSSQCFYMVTIETEGRRPLLGEVVGSIKAPDGSPDAPRLAPSELGNEVQRAWWAISDYHPQVAVVGLQLMPDHLHGILYFREKTDLHLGDVIRGFKTGCNRAYRRLSAASPFSFAATMSQPTGEGRADGRKVRHAGLLWAEGYNDRILHNYSTLDRWKAYLHDNPRRLLVKRQNPDFFRVRRNVEYAGMNFSAQGNLFLLHRPLKVQVRCSRSLTEAEIAVQCGDMMKLGMEGAVFVSPGISKGEKTIMRAVFTAGYPVIFLQENGLADLAKPGGQRFDACARGQMHIIKTGCLPVNGGQPESYFYCL
ncbi:MAG: hypothetical protein IJV45_01695 [Prevotella sp.]|nr:hypothetical protein [Prevotella sp.]